MHTLIYNDLHFGVKRTAGTTPATQIELRSWLLNSFLAHALDFANDLNQVRLIINGDLLDGFDVEAGTLREVYDVFTTLLNTDKVAQLIFVMGNHDASAKGNRVSSFHLLTHFLRSADPRVMIIDHNDGLFPIRDSNLWVISHQLNQALFDLEIDRAINEGGNDRFLLLHCNVKNTFAENSDHSLNLSDEQLGDLMRAGWSVIVGHEHQGYELRGGRVIVTGNQFPSSVADCLGNNRKSMLILDGMNWERETTWEAHGSFTEVDWQTMNEVSDTLQFIRVTGDASAAEGENVLRAIAHLRQRHPAFVITNAVKVEGQTMSEEVLENLEEAVKVLDIKGLILDQCNDREKAAIKELLGGE